MEGLQLMQAALGPVSPDHGKGTAPSTGMNQHSLLEATSKRHMIGPRKTKMMMLSRVGLIVLDDSLVCIIILNARNAVQSRCVQQRKRMPKSTDF